MSDIRVKIHDLKSRMSKYLCQVKHGYTIIITRYGRSVGRLLPVEGHLDERLKALQNAGMVAWNGQKLAPITSPAINQNEKQVSDIPVEMCK